MRTDLSLPNQFWSCSRGPGVTSVDARSYSPDIIAIYCYNIANIENIFAVICDAKVKEARSDFTHIRAKSRFCELAIYV